MSKPISIVLVDDHTIVRNGLKSLIEVIGDFKVIAEFDNGRHFVDAFPGLNNPDLVIVDMNMPEMDGLDTMRWLKRNSPMTKALILTIESEEKTIIELFRLGIKGYLPKSCSASVLKSAIEDVVFNGFYHSDALRHALTAEVLKPDHKYDLYDRISEREMAFLQLVCDEREYTYEVISELLGVSRRTVDGYRESLFTKFNIKSKLGLVLFAIKHELVKV